MRSALTVGLVIAATACSKLEASQQGLTVSVPEQPDGSAGAAPSADVVGKAKDVVKAATDSVQGCTLLENTIYDTWGFDVYEKCPLPREATESLKKAALALETAAGNPPPESALASFLAQTRMFRDWLELAAQVKDARGILLHYQQLALAWNEWQPSAKVPVDPPYLLELIKKGHGTGEHSFRDGRLFWRRGFDGPRL